MNSIMISNAEVIAASKDSIYAFAEGKNKKGNYIRFRVMEPMEGSQPIYRLVYAEETMMEKAKMALKIGSKLMLTAEEKAYRNKEGKDEYFLKLQDFHLLAEGNETQTKTRRLPPPDECAVSKIA